jgi:hypothetical protein
MIQRQILDVVGDAGIQGIAIEQRGSAEPGVLHDHGLTGEDVAAVRSASR